MRQLLSGKNKNGGAEQNRTDDPHNAIVVLYQLSYDPTNAGNMRGAPARVNLIHRYKPNTSRPASVIID